MEPVEAIFTFTLVPLLGVASVGLVTLLMCELAEWNERRKRPRCPNCNQIPFVVQHPNWFRCENCYTDIKC